MGKNRPKNGEKYHKMDWFGSNRTSATSLQKIRSKDRIFFRLGKPWAQPGEPGRGRLPRRNRRQSMKPGKASFIARQMRGIWGRLPLARPALRLRLVHSPRCGGKVRRVADTGGSYHCHRGSSAVEQWKSGDSQHGVWVKRRRCRLVRPQRHVSWVRLPPPVPIFMIHRFRSSRHFGFASSIPRCQSLKTHLRLCFQGDKESYLTFCLLPSDRHKYPHPRYRAHVLCILACNDMNGDKFKISTWAGRKNERAMVY